MPTFLLFVKAELENVESISLPDDASYTLTVKDSTGDDTREGVVVSPLEEVELSGSRGVVNFAMKWSRDARHEASLNVQQIKGVTRQYCASDVGSYVPIAAFECRGLEPIDWQPGENFIATGLGKTVWEEVDLSSGEWADYDEDTQESVSIMELSWKFEAYRPKK